MLNSVKTSHGRGCGFRKPGALYAVSGLGEGGLQVEEFIVDPIVPFKWHRGSEIIVDKNGIGHIFIFVGKEFYPSPWDFVEEVRRFGASRKIPKKLNLESLKPGLSKMLFIHRYAEPKFLTYDFLGLEPNEFCLLNEKVSAKDTLSPHQHPLYENSACTYSLKYFSALHHPEAEEVGEGFLKINFASFSYTIPKISQVMAVNKIIKEEWISGIFLSLPLTGFEAKDFVDKKTEQKVKDVGFELDVLDY